MPPRLPLALALCLALLALLTGSGPCLAESCGGQPGYISQIGLPYGRPFHVTEMRSYGADQECEDPPDCLKDDLDLYGDKVDYNTRTLDIYHPATGSIPRKVIFFVHGGGWEGGYKGWYSFVPTIFTGREGWVTVVVDYVKTSDQTFTAQTCPDRESCTSPNPEPYGWEKAGNPPEYTADSKAGWYPDNIDDVAQALVWVREHIAQAPYHGDPNQIFVMGHSAGAHLVSLLATDPRFAAQNWGTSRPYFSLRGSIRGVISLSGVYDLNLVPWLMLGDQLDQLIKGCGHGLEPDCAEDDFNPISPSWHLAQNPDATYPPFLVINAGDDLPTFQEQADLLVPLLQGRAPRVDQWVLEGFDHVTEVKALKFDTKSEPLSGPFGDQYQCVVDFGPIPRPEGYKNPTDRIIEWIKQIGGMGVGAQAAVRLLLTPRQEAQATQARAGANLAWLPLLLGGN